MVNVASKAVEELSNALVEEISVPLGLKFLAVG